MQKEELEKLKAEIRKNYLADMAAIDQLLTKYGESRRALSNQQTALAMVNHVGKNTSDIVEDLIRNSNEKFNVYDILLKLKAQTGKAPNADRGRIVSQVINRLRQRDPSEIEEIEKGKGRRSGTYRYKHSINLS